MFPPLMLSATTHRERNSAIAFAFECIHEFGGWIDDLYNFSNIMTNVRFSIPNDKMIEFSSALRKAGLNVDLNTTESLATSLSPKTERLGSLQITFVHNEPDLKSNVLAIPGY
jgi:hypothetical protein